MSTTVTISPVTRIEGHLAVHTETEEIGSAGDGFRVSSAHCEGEMFRGFEQILRGRDPLDAQQITQRICGVCPVSHGIASVRAQEQAYKIKLTHNARLLQVLIQAANFLQSHILQFYHLAALDYVDVTAVLKYSGRDRTLRGVKAWVEGALSQNDSFAAAPFLPRYEAQYVKDLDRNASLLSHYIQALEVRRLCHEMGSVFGARLPHTTALVPGGCTQTPTLERVLEYRSRLEQVQGFVEGVFLPDLLDVAAEFPAYFDIGKGYGDFLSYGAFDADASGEKWIKPGVIVDGKWEPFDPRHIIEEVTHSWYEDIGVRHPSKGETHPHAEKSGAYSWIKSPRYRGRPLEVGALARVMVNYADPNAGWMKKEVDAFCAAQGVPVEKLVSVLGRFVARGLESLWLTREAFRWLEEIEPNGAAACEFALPQEAAGVGLTEAPRGALGHWLAIKDYQISNYQCVVPTTWNCSPRDGQGNPGPVEKALEGTVVADPSQPIEVGRVVRSFDPCIACAVH